MGRRSLISISNINKMIKRNNALRRQHEKTLLIKNRGNGPKELKPREYLYFVEFDEITRYAKVDILWEQDYRTIERYVTQNYKKYPIYSDWKKKSKHIIRKIRLTNVVLENLNKHNDELIRRFSEEIIIKLNNDMLIPSWMQKKYINLELEEKINEFKSNIERINIDCSKYVEIKKEQIYEMKTNLYLLERKLYKTNKLSERITKSINKIEEKKSSIFIILITFGIYCIVNSERRKKRLMKKLLLVKKLSDNYSNEVKASTENINNIEATITSEKIKCEKDIEFIKNEIVSEIQIAENKIHQIIPLSNSITEDDFISLKSLNAFEKEKIVGCYVIWNTEFNKYYVGQSKNVINRLHQHFKGTVPANIIFAEDYYKSNFENKEDIFKFKIIRLDTKDELDTTEKELIEYYDSWNNGYNGTSGNN